VVVSRRWLLWRVSRLRNLSERTIKLYSVFLRSFEKKLSDGKGQLRLAEVTPELTRAYFTARMQQETI
jgi:site-specific recombinase XerD